MTRRKNMPFIFCKLLKGRIFETLCLRWPGSKWRYWILVGRHWQRSAMCRKNTVSISFIPSRSPGDFSGSFQSNTWHTVVIREWYLHSQDFQDIAGICGTKMRARRSGLVYLNVNSPINERHLYMYVYTVHSVNNLCHSWNVLKEYYCPVMM